MKKRILILASVAVSGVAAVVAGNVNIASATVDAYECIVFYGEYDNGVTLCCKPKNHSTCVYFDDGCRITLSASTLDKVK